MAKQKEISPETVKPRDGYDNTGTQGYDSLSDDAFKGSSDTPDSDSGTEKKGTGSSSKDFPDRRTEE